MIVTPLETLPKLAERLRDDEIHVWHLSYEASLGRAPLRRVLAAYLGVPEDAVDLTNNQHGRPELGRSLASPLDFNWSHSGRHALIAIGRHISPGVDVERRRDRPRALEIAQRYFTREESDALAALPIDRRHMAFLDLWTAKEAVLKAIGRGIAFGLDRLNIASNADQLRLSRLDGDDVEKWQLRRLSLRADLVGALAWRGSPREIRTGALAMDP